jgi:hypothetical protein
MQEMRLRVLDLFSGLGGWSQAFIERGHEVVRVDIEPGFQPDLVADVAKLTPEEVVEAFGGRSPHIVLASPPCEGFSIAAIGRNWEVVNGRLVPRTPTAVTGIRLVRATVALIKALAPGLWWVENPRGALRKLGLIPADWDHVTVWYCHYGEDRAKPTDLWGRFGVWEPRPPCSPRARGCGAAKGRDAWCHTPAPRGARTGTQGLASSAERAVVPWELSSEVADAAEAWFEVEALGEEVEVGA